MSSIAGLLTDDLKSGLQICGDLLAPQKIYGPDGQSAGSLGNATFGRCLFRLLAEDVFDQQPVIGCDGTAMLVADIRIDNRDALVTRIASASEARTWSDSRLLLQAYETWGIGLLDHVVGDFAFAIYDCRQNRVYLGRDPTGQRPLHYRYHQGRFEFASMPVGLLATAQNRRSIDPTKITSFLDGWSEPRSTSYFKNINRVPPGHYVEFANGALTTRQYWNPQPKVLRLGRDEDYVAAFHEQLEQSVKARLRDAGPLVGAHLSSGRDSSAVSAVAARLIASSGGRIIAATGAPRCGFAGKAPPNKLIDESGIAAKTARIHPNIDHVIVRPKRSFDFRDCAHLWDYYQEPYPNACNYPWLADIDRAFGAAGVSVCLTGDMGNLTISAGGYGFVPNFLAQGSWQSWLREVHDLSRQQKMRWRGALALSGGGFMPPTLWAFLMRVSGRTRVDRKPLVRDVWQPQNSANAARSQPPRGFYQQRVSTILNTNVGAYRKGNLAQFGIDERDATSDRRLIEFCLSLPAEQLLKDGVERPLFTRAMTGLVAPEVLAGNLRGLQAADWYADYTRSTLQNYVAAVAENASVAAIIDVSALKALVDTWPDSPDLSPDDVAAFRTPMMKTLSAAYFIAATDGK